MALPSQWPLCFGHILLRRDSLAKSNRPNKLDFLRSEEHTSELQSPVHLVCRLLLEIKNDLSRPCCESWVRRHGLDKCSTSPSAVFQSRVLQATLAPQRASSPLYYLALLIV